MYIQNHFFLSFPQVKNKPYHFEEYAFILERGAVMNSCMYISISSKGLVHTYTYRYVLYMTKTLL
jgi:hypothetical protein